MTKNLCLNARRIFRQYYITCRVPLGLEKIKPSLTQNVSEVHVVSEIENCPQELFFKDKPVTEIRCKRVSADKEKLVRFDFGAPLNVSGAEVLKFGYNARSDSNLLNVTLYGSDGRIFSSLISVSTERWSNVLIDLKDCGFLDAVKAISFTSFGENRGVLIEPHFQIADCCFGKILDLSFRRGDMSGYFITDGTVKSVSDGLFFSFDKGQSLTFPEFANARYSVLNFVYGIRDSVVLTLTNLGGEREFLLQHTSQNNKTGITSFTAPPKGQRGRVVVKVSLIDGERMTGLTLAPAGTGKGALIIHAVSFEQESDSPLSDSEKAFFSMNIPDRSNPFFKNTMHSSGLKHNPEKTFCVSSFGAVGDGYINDNPAISRALDACERAGGGVVVVEAGVYRISHLRLGKDTELRLESGAVLCQSDDPADYPYSPVYEHDSPSVPVNWAHNCLVSNYPLIYAADTENVKITGEGVIRCCDSGSEVLSAGFPNWPVHCGGTIHCIPIGFFKVRNAEISGIKIIRSSTYHMFMVHCENVFINGVKCYDVRCLSADGIGLCGSKNVLIHKCFVRTNDDGVTLFSVYDDPRACSWWSSTKGEDNGVKNIEVSHSYIDSACGGAGKAIAFIPWGSDAPDVFKQEISDIYIHDCILTGGHSIGAWPDNPYNGKQPFDNTETDDYSPVKNIRIFNNKMNSPVTLECIKADNVSSDCGLGSESDEKGYNL